MKSARTVCITRRWDAIFPLSGLTPLLPHEVKPRLKLNTQWIEEITGERPRSFLAPRLFGSTAVCQALEELGHVSDASYATYHYRDRLEPYHASADDWTVPGPMKLVGIPNFADLTVENIDPYGRECDQWPIFRTESAEILLGRIDSFLVCLQFGGNKAVVVGPTLTRAVMAC